MQKSNVYIRLANRAEIEAIAEREGRKLSGLINHIVQTWLKERKEKEGKK